MAWRAVSSTRVPNGNVRHTSTAMTAGSAQPGEISQGTPWALSPRSRTP